MNGKETERHQVQVLMRKEMTVQGVKDVESFDENGAVLQTTAGEMTVEGRDVRIGVLDVERGVLTLTGRIDAVVYSDGDPKEKGRFFKRKNR